MSEPTPLAQSRAHGVASVMLDEATIQRRVAELAAELDDWYRPASGDHPVPGGGEVPLLVGVLTGAVTFLTDLMRAMTVPLEIEFMAVSSYGASTESSGVVRILKDLDHEISGRRVVVVEDIIDTGLTLQYLLDLLQRRAPAEIRVVALLRKHEKPGAVPVPVDLVGFDIPDEFVVGYGLDYAGHYRNLPYVAVLNPRVFDAPDPSRPD
ncbi:MAG: Hypoxanthine-guanine phosphoribosyltransferase [uncultured Thermomicrobiales bacterium]|uniref:Hypoxanthine phosphoribosyltransferase n=1 Tax=uncultured Thermomicrobiales bacterium TaxID=1645740 RepID=A0A6J4UG97_9BACT|nr:MAG: Hypoxanthine-guanine phosphoribosyltransferase [uncultured Thermomicrobiales bacterium]